MCIIVFDHIRKNGMRHYVMGRETDTGDTQQNKTVPDRVQMSCKEKDYYNSNQQPHPAVVSVFLTDALRYEHPHRNKQNAGCQKKHKRNLKHRFGLVNICEIVKQGSLNDGYAGHMKY